DLTVRISDLKSPQERLTRAVVSRLGVLGVVAARITLPDFDGGVRERLTILIRVDDRQHQRQRETWPSFCDVASEERLVADHPETIRIWAFRFARRNYAARRGQAAARRTRTRRRIARCRAGGGEGDG